MPLPTNSSSSKKPVYTLKQEGAGGAHLFISLLRAYAQDVLRSQLVLRSWATLLARSKLRSIPNDTCSINFISSAFRQLEIEARGSQASNCGCAIWGAKVKFHFTVLLEVQIGDYRSLTNKILCDRRPSAVQRTLGKRMDTQEDVCTIEPQPVHHAMA
ncbi:hypothetical protein VNO77_49290 [Canavalia gladiata]|uniref:Uncharacterized protein n=1 Tax=Canavalia gladiata TaxID=3824 RepID=A0AAN9JEU6_CANGL